MSMKKTLFYHNNETFNCPSTPHTHTQIEDSSKYIISGLHHQDPSQKIITKIIGSFEGKL